jgi:hypothetical protein
MNKASGVDPSWAGTGAPAGYTWLNQTSREFQVCFKCHSTYTTLSTYLPDGWNGTALVPNGLKKLTSANAQQVLDSRNMAQEFNPNNASYHPVAAQGTNQNIPAGSWTTGSGMSQTSIIYCSSCHGNPNSATQGAGPHGSPMLHILQGTSQYKTVDSGTLMAAGEICFKCHSRTTYLTSQTDTNTNFNRNGAQNLHEVHGNGERVSCYVCHDTHGSEQLHLINFDTSVVTIKAGYNSQTAWEKVGSTRSCYISCHGVAHGGADQKTYTHTP